MSEQLALVCEGEHDRFVAEALVERILEEDIEWYSGNEDYLREWCRKNGNAALYWKEIKGRFRFHGGKHRSLGSLHTHGDGLAAERALHIIDLTIHRKRIFCFCGIVMDSMNGSMHWSRFGNNIPTAPY